MTSRDLEIYTVVTSVSRACVTSVGVDALASLCKYITSVNRGNQTMFEKATTVCLCPEECQAQQHEAPMNQ